jgi:alpha,alpha-trehalase
MNALWSGERKPPEVRMNAWSLVYEGYDPDEEGLREALCTLGNGYFATRGAAPETRADDVHYPGTYRAGCFNRLATTISGETVENESLVNLLNWLDLTFRPEDGDWFHPDEAEILSYAQQLDMRRGVLTRQVRYRDGEGRRTAVTQRRLVSMSDPHIGALETTLKAENWSGVIEIRSALDGRVVNGLVDRYSQLANQHLRPVDSEAVDDQTLCLQAETVQSHIRIAAAARTRVLANGEEAETECSLHEEPGYIAHQFALPIEEGDSVVVEKVVSLFTSRDRPLSESRLQARKAISRAGTFDRLLEAHVLAWSHLWQRFEIDVGSEERNDRILHLYLFHVLQTVSPHTRDLDIGVPARGWHGEAYRGHIFWDELFVFPLLTYRMPDATRAVLEYRHRRLDEARWAARQAGYAGAMYPWQSGSDGREESQTLHLNPRSGRWIPDNSRLQRHINVAVAYNIWQHHQVSGDTDFMCSCGAEMLLEIARFWSSIATYDRSRGRYVINGVMGPDEYHDSYPGAEEPGLNNNAYTNVMAVWVLRRALELLDLLPDQRRRELWETLSLTREEMDRWEDISRKMFVPFHDDGIISQFEGYEELEELDWKRYRAEHGDVFRLDRILEAEGDTPNWYKASKQADVLMLFYLLSADELNELFERLGYELDYEMIPRTVQYYLERTSHGSTLSGVVHSWVLARSDRERSWNFFRRALESDISDIQGGTTPEGIHLGAMSGSLDLVQRCYTGLEPRGETLWFSPALPEELQQIRFCIQYRGSLLNVDLTAERLRLTALPSAAGNVQVGYEGDKVQLQPGDRHEFRLR